MQAKVPSSPGGLQVAGICATLGGRDSNCSGFIGSGCQSRHPTQSVTSRDVRNPLVGLGQGLFKVEKEGSQYIISVASIAGCIIVLLSPYPSGEYPGTSDQKPHGDKLGPLGPQAS